MTTETEEFDPEHSKDYYEDFYQDLRERIREWLQTEEGQQHKFADYIMFAPDLFHVLVRLMFDSRVSVPAKAKMGMALAYFISPVDVVPEAIVGPVGYIDDVAVAAYVLNQFVNQEGEEAVVDHWAGDEDVLKVIQAILEMANEVLGSGFWNTAKNMFGLGGSN